MHVENYCAIRTAGNGAGHDNPGKDMSKSTCGYPPERVPTVLSRLHYRALAH